jgi:UDP-N-acetylglucosamine 2-epimerase (non-hydrolysing)
VSRRVLSVFGTRPEAIKMAPVVRRLEAAEGIESVVCVTGQHREMLDAVLRLFEIRPQHDLALMRPGQDLFDVTSGALLGLREVLREERPDIVLVHGDTTTCFAGALAAFYEGIPVGHVEAGLRTGDLGRPFPEELNRVLTGRMASQHFAPTAGAGRNLLAEGVDPRRVRVTGNTVIDALLEVRDRIRHAGPERFEGAFPADLLERLAAGPEKLVLVTGHRRESFGQGFEDLCGALARLARAHPEWLFVYPVHLNPNVRRPVQAHLAGLTNVILTEPADYEPFVWLMDRADLIVTDSGGVQEEAPALGVPVLVTREVTERPEAVEAGTVALVGTDPGRLTAAVEELLGGGEAAERMARAVNPYGDGRAAERIVRVLQGRSCEDFAPSEALDTATAA